MFSTLLMGGGGHAREKDHQNVKLLRVSLFLHAIVYVVSSNDNFNMVISLCCK